MSRSRAVLASALAGAVSGGRSMTPLAALTLTAPAHGRRQPDRTLRRGTVRALSVAAAAGEYVGDKLPSAPSRLEPAGLGARVVTAAGSAVVIARRRGGDPVRDAVLAASAAVVTSWLGVTWRRRAAQRFGRDLPGALIEDGVVLGLATAMARLA